VAGWLPASYGKLKKLLPEYDDVREVKELQFSFKKKKYVGVDMELYVMISRNAKALNKSEDALINEWLSEKATAH
jgi:hypothetical protein